MEIIEEMQIFTFWSTDIESFDKLADVFTFKSKHSHYAENTPSLDSLELRNFHHYLFDRI